MGGQVRLAIHLSACILYGQKISWSENPGHKSNGLKITESSGNVPMSYNVALSQHR